MTQGEFYFLVMVIGALTLFASVLAYGSWVASGNAPPSQINLAAASRHNAGPKGSVEEPDVRKAA